MIELIVFAVLFMSFAVLSLYRLVMGPHAADRIVAADNADILVACSMILFSLYSGRGIYLDIAIICAMLGIINTMLVGRYLDRGRWVYESDVEDSN